MYQICVQSESNKMKYKSFREFWKPNFEALKFKVYFLTEYYLKCHLTENRPTKHIFSVNSCQILIHEV